jgi:hypothetical protein
MASARNAGGTGRVPIAGQRAGQTSQHGKVGKKGSEEARRGEPIAVSKVEGGKVPGTRLEMSWCLGRARPRGAFVDVPCCPLHGASNVVDAPGMLK